MDEIKNLLHYFIKDLLWAILPIFFTFIFACIAGMYFTEIWGRLTLGFMVFVFIILGYRKH